MIVMKFGGVSTKDAPSIRMVISIIQNRLHEKPILVFSAMGLTTRHLLESAVHASKGDEASALRILETLKKDHDSVIVELLSHDYRKDTQIQIDQYFQEIEKLLGGLSIIGELSPRSQDKILSYGEFIATTILGSVLEQSSIPAKVMDARDIIITDNRFTRAEPIGEILEEKIPKTFVASFKDNKIPVVQGFVGATREGATTTLGFEGSDFTASLLGSILNANRIEVWKDVPGLMTTDPSIISACKLVQELTYAEAAELTFFGAKILHPSTIEPARSKNIPIHICHLHSPDDTGTIISSQEKREKGIKSITYKRGLDLLTIENPPSNSIFDFFNGVFDVLHRHHILPTVVSTSGLYVKMVLILKEESSEFLDELNHFGHLKHSKGKSTVTLVGYEIDKALDLPQNLWNALNDIPVHFVAQGISPHQFTLVVDEENLEIIIERLHHLYFER